MRPDLPTKRTTLVPRPTHEADHPADEGVEVASGGVDVGLAPGAALLPREAAGQEALS